MPANQRLLSGVRITSDNVAQYAPQLNAALPVDLADLIEGRHPQNQVVIFNCLEPKLSVKTFEYLSFRTQMRILQALPSPRVAALLNALSPDDRTAFLEDLPPDLVNQLLQFLSPEERSITSKLLGYPEDSVGRLMTPDYLTIKRDWTVKEVLDYIREKGRDTETLNVIYAVDDNGVLVDDFRIRQFLLAPLNIKAKELSDGTFIALKVNDSAETAINVFRKYGRSALPVIDQRGVLLGIVTSDDIMQLSVEVDTEDMQKIGAVAALGEPYMDVPFFSLIQKRVGWLILLFIGEMMTASAMAIYADEVSRAVILAVFLPLIISSGGNAGAQASTLIIRAMALGEVGLKDWWRIMRREVMAGVLLGIALGAIGFFRVSFSALFTDFYGSHSILIAWTISLSLIGVVLWGSLTGAMLPLVLKRCGFDPAVSSAPLVATLVDVTGLVIYFSIAMFVLKGTLL